MEDGRMDANYRKASLEKKMFSFRQDPQLTASDVNLQDIRDL